MEVQLKVSSSLPLVKGNFEEIKSRLEAELKQYDLIVDADSVKTAKKMATTINKLSKEIDTVRKDKVAELQAPIKEFEKQAKLLTSLCQESRQKLLSQVKVFDDKEIERAKKLLKVELEATYSKYGIRDEFKTVIVEDLAIISNLTKTGLAAKARKAIDERVLAKKQFQEKIGTRLLSLEAICYKGGLQVPLTRENINHFLMVENDDEYLKKLVSLINNEISRLQKAKQVQEERKAVQTMMQEVNEKPANNIVEDKKPSGKYSHFKNMNEFKTHSEANKNIGGKKTYVITATFEVTVDENISSKLESMLIYKFEKAGFKQTPHVEIHEKQLAC